MTSHQPACKSGGQLGTGFSGQGQGRPPSYVCPVCQQRSAAWVSGHALVPGSPTQALPVHEHQVLGSHLQPCHGDSRRPQLRRVSRTQKQWGCSVDCNAGWPQTNPEPEAPTQEPLTPLPACLAGPGGTHKSVNSSSVSSGVNTSRSPITWRQGIRQSWGHTNDVGLNTTSRVAELSHSCPCLCPRAARPSPGTLAHRHTLFLDGDNEDPLGKGQPHVWAGSQQSQRSSLSSALSSLN